MMSSKTREKIMKELGQDFINELDGLSGDALKKRVVVASHAIKETKEQLDENPKYIEIKEQKSALESGFRAVKKRQDCIIAYCLDALTERGEDTALATKGEAA